MKPYMLVMTDDTDTDAQFFDTYDEASDYKCTATMAGGYCCELYERTHSDESGCAYELLES